MTKDDKKTDEAPRDWKRLYEIARRSLDRRIEAGRSELPSEKEREEFLEAWTADAIRYRNAPEGSAMRRVIDNANAYFEHLARENHTLRERITSAAVLNPQPDSQQPCPTSSDSSASSPTVMNPTDSPTGPSTASTAAPSSATDPAREPDGDEIEAWRKRAIDLFVPGITSNASPSTMTMFGHIEAADAIMRRLRDELRAAIADRQRAEEIQGELATELAALRAAKPAPTSDLAKDELRSIRAWAMDRFNEHAATDYGKGMKELARKLIDLTDSCIETVDMRAPKPSSRVAEPAGDGALRRAAKQLRDAVTANSECAVLVPLDVQNAMDMVVALAAQEPPADEKRNGIFNEDALRAEIVSKWGPAGAHVEVFDDMRKQLAAAREERDEAVDDWTRQNDKHHDAALRHAAKLAAARAEAGKLAVEELRKQADECDERARYCRDRETVHRRSDGSRVVADEYNGHATEAGMRAGAIRSRIAALESQAKPEAAQVVSDPIVTFSSKVSMIQCQFDAEDFPRQVTNALDELDLRLKKLEGDRS